MAAEKVLALTGLSKTFGTVVANNDVSLDLYRGEVLALLGENGAGKTTLMNMLFGHYMPDAGGIEIADRAGTLRPLQLGHPQAAIAAGVGMVHQHFTLAENIDALDNIMLGAEPLLKVRRNKSAAREKVRRIMADSGLSAPLDVPVGRLTVGERQRVEILKALYRDVNVLVLDEPTAVLTPQEADTLFENIGAMTRGGLSVIFISHKLREVLAFSHRIAVLRHGEKVGEIATTEADERKIARMMVGADTPETRREARPPGDPILLLKKVSVPGRSRRDSLERVDLEVREGEILGIAGISGNGQIALAGVISGTSRPTEGSMSVGGTQIVRHDPSAMIEAGVGRIPEDRHRDGIVGAMSVAENLVIERLGDPQVQSRGMLRRDAILSHAEQLCQDFDVRGPGSQAAARLLSGGNIQKLILARVFEQQPRLILANQPTRGLDMGAAAEVARRLLEARSRGAGVVLISEDLDEILGLADRILVIHDGELAEADSRDREVLGLLMAGEARMIRIEPRSAPSRALKFGVPVLSAVVALLLAAIPLSLAGASIGPAYVEMFKGVFGTRFAFSEMLTRATPLIFTGLAAALAFRARLWNIGAEGQLYLGAMAAVAVGAGAVDAPAIILLPLIVFCGCAAGATGMAVPAYLKTRFGADEVVTTLLLNFVILIFVQFMLEGPLKDPMGLGWPQSSPILDQGMLPPLMDRMRIHSGLIIALVCAAVAQFLLARSVWGFKLRAVGENSAAALHAGIPVKRTLFGVAVVSGALAGMAGVSEVAGLKGYLTSDLSPGFGYTGIVVAMLAGLSPAGVVAAAIFIASVFVGADSMSRAMGVSSFLADLVVSTSLLCVLVGGFFARFRLVRTTVQKGSTG